MKKLLFILSIFFYISSYSQTRSATSGFSPRANQTFVVEDGNLSARNSLFTPRFIDTVEAATYILKDTIGNVIYLTSTHSLWVRTIASGSTKKWTEIGSGGGGNLIVQNAGSGTQTWFTSGDTLYMKKVKNTTFISASTDTDSSLLISLSATGTPSSTTFLAGDNTWKTVATGLTVGTTTITSGTNTRVLYNNSGVLGEYTVTGSGTTIPLSTSPDFTTGITIGSVAVPTISSTNTLSNKRWTPRVGSTTSSATPTINTDNVDIYKLTAQTVDITSFTTNLSGTPVDGDLLQIQITGTASRAITWGASFVSSTVTLPTTTSNTATLTTTFEYFTTSSYGNNKWVCTGAY